MNTSLRRMVCVTSALLLCLASVQSHANGYRGHRHGGYYGPGWGGVAIGLGVGFGLGFASTKGQVETGSLGIGDYYWGGAASTIFWVDPKEDLTLVFMTQLMPSGTFNFRGQLKSLIYAAITD